MTSNRCVAAMIAATTGLAASGGLAACPTADDLDRGIRFEVDTGDHEVFTRTSAHVVQADYHFAGSDAGVRALLGKGLYVLALVDFDGSGPIADTRASYSFGMDAAQLPDLRDMQRWSTEVAGRDVDGLFSERHEYFLGPAAPRAYGDCNYLVRDVTIRLIDDEATETVHWLPELGLSYLAGYSDAEGTDVYIYTDVSAVE